jgi:hypothetical protein
MTSQLLIQMPAEGAARLLTLSLLEQISQYASASGLGDPRQATRYAETYRASVRRLRSCMALYADALGDSVPRKARRRLRRLVDATERLHRADVQLAWVGRHVPSPGQRENGAPLGEGARTAAWLYDRLARRRERARRVLERVQSDARPLRRIAKRLGIYTTAVRLDTVATQQSFARMTSDQLLAQSDALGAAIRTALSPGDHAELRRARRSAEHLGYLLDPLRAYADVEEPSMRVARLRAALDRLDDVRVIARAIVRAGSRIAAVHASEALRVAIWPPPDGTPPPATDAANGRASVPPAELQRGLLVLAESLHDEGTHAFDAVTAAWRESGSDAFIERITGIAIELQG